MPTALVTGLYGQDGSLLAEHLLACSYRVVGVVRPGSTPLDAARGALAARCEIVELDVARADEWASDLVARVQPDEIYALAACHRSSDPTLRDDPAMQQRMVLVNHAAPLALAHAVIANGNHASIVVATSSQMYRPALPVLRVDEQTPHSPATFYGVTKSGCQVGIRWLREQQGLRGACAILFNHESTRRTVAFASRRITRAAARIAAGLETSLELVDLSSRVDFSSAIDVVAGMHVMGTAPTPEDCVIASGELHSLEDLCAVAFTAVGLDWRAHVTSATTPGERPALVGDATRLASLGWVRTRPFEQWIEEMVATDREAASEH